MRAPVSAVLLTREDELLEQAIASVRPHVAEVVVVNTGPKVEPFPSGVDQYAHLLACNDESGRIANFSFARNHAFSKATQPWVLWLDADDVVTGLEHLPALLREAERVRATGKDVRILAPYEYAYDADGDCCLLQGRERIVNRDAFRWERPVHEGLVPLRPGEHVDLHTDKIVWRHQRHKLTGSQDRDADRNLRILRAQVEEHGLDARLHFDLGVEFAIRAQAIDDGPQRDECERLAEEHLTAARAQAAKTDDAAIASLKLCECMLRQSLHATITGGQRFNPSVAEAHAFSALRVRDTWDAPYLAIARIAYITASAGHVTDSQARALIEKAIRYARLGLQCAPIPMPHPRNPLERSLGAHEILHDCLARTGDLEGALEHVTLALKVKPRAEHLVRSRREYEKRLGTQRIAAHLSGMRAAGAIDDSALEIIQQALSEPEKLKKRLRYVAPVGDATDRLRDYTARVRKDAPLRIVFACGKSLEEWDATTPNTTGIGGSETAVVEMAKRLAARGHDVRVYNSCPSEYQEVGANHDRGRLRYLRAGKLFMAEPCDVLVAWRDARLLDPEEGPRASVRSLWVHDVLPFNATYERLLQADEVLALSKWHRSHLIEKLGLHPSHVRQTRNGIDPKRFQVDIKFSEDGRQATCDIPFRDRHKVVYSSSPDRGLAMLLRCWPSIKDSVPDATLHVFYGFDSWEKAADLTKSQAMREEMLAIKRQAEELSGMGVHLRGRMNQQDLAREFLSAGAWFYPSHTKDGPFTETSCITGMEAQAAGLHIVTARSGALPETVRFGTLVDDTGGPLFEEDFSRACIRVLEGISGALLRETVMVDAAKHFDWEGVVDEWETAWRLLLERGCAIPAYQPEEATTRPSAIAEVA